MKLHACIKDNVVDQLVEIVDEEQYQFLAKNYSTILDISETIPQPQVGWVFNGTGLEHPSFQNLSEDEFDSFQQTAQRQYGQKLMEKLVDSLGARNLKLTREQTPVDVASLAGQLSAIKLLLETGALKTVRGLCVAIKPAFPNHSDILQSAIDDITVFLETNDFE
jgi:hypothetical protein